MRRALTWILAAAVLCPPGSSAERKSWNQIRYIGGTIQVKTSRYDWNTTVTLSGDTIVVEIAPATVFSAQKTVRIKPSKVVSVSIGTAAWRNVAAIEGAQLPAKHPTLFGLLTDSNDLSLVYDGEDGKRGALLLDIRMSAAVLQALTKLTGKPVEDH